MTARRFELHRDEDASGVSGTGVVAEGIAFSDGVVALRWIVPAGVPGHGYPTSVVFHDNGLRSVEAIHGHGGKTRIVFPEPVHEVIPPEVVRLLGEVDGQLGLGIYREPKASDRWKEEARELVVRIRKVIG